MVLPVRPVRPGSARRDRILVAASAQTWGADGRSNRVETAIAYGLYIVDALFVAALIWRDGGLGSPFYILFVLLAVKAVSVVQVLPNMVWLPFVFWPPVRRGAVAGFRERRLPGRHGLS